MSFTGSLSSRHGDDRPPLALLSRLLAFLRAPMLDAQLASGVRPSASLAHRLRAEHLRRRRVRRHIAQALNRAVVDAARPVPARTPQAPLHSQAVRGCAREIRALSREVVTADNPRAQGVAIAFQLAFDGGSPLFDSPHAPNGNERLANTIQVARSALRVSGEFDGTGS
jgi:hypothetical protein